MRYFASLLVALVLFAFATPVQAQEGTKIAVVDMQLILSGSKASKSIKNQLEKKRESFKKEFSKREDELRKEEQVLAKKRSELNAKDFTEKKIAFEKKLLEANKLAQKRRRAMDEALNKSLAKVSEEAIVIIADIAEKDKIDLVISKQNVVIGTKSIDLTPTVLEKLNAKLKSVSVSIKE